MGWRYQHDPIGVPDYPKEFWNLSSECRILDYWTNDDGVRIGFFGHAKGIAIFTYMHEDINLRFKVIRAPGQLPDLLPRGDRTLGPICKVFISQSLPSSFGSPFGKHGRGIVRNIRDFMKIYKDPRYPSPVAIDAVLIHPSDEYYSDQNGVHSDV